MPYAAITNTPGYSPMDDDPPYFDTAAEAWCYLADERKRCEDDFEVPGESYSGTALALEHFGYDEVWPKAAETTAGYHPHIAIHGTGTIYGDTPGYSGDHDLGVAYTVLLVTDEELGETT